MYFLNEKQIDTISYYPAWKGTDLREAHGVDQTQQDASRGSSSISTQI